MFHSNNAMAFPSAFSLAMNIAQQEQQQRKRAVSPPSNTAAAILVAAAAKQHEQREQQKLPAASDDGDDDEVQVVGTTSPLRRPQIMMGASSSPSRHPSIAASAGMKRDRSDEDEESVSSPERRVARRISNSKEEQKVCMSKLVLSLLKTDDEATIAQIVPQVLVALHEKDNDRRLLKQQDFFQCGGHLAVVTVMHKYPTVQLIQQSGIIVLLHASYRNSVLRRAIGTVEGIQAILKAMKTFSTERDVLYQGFQALVNLASEKPNAEIMVARLQAVPFLLDKMTQYCQLSDVLRWGCELIKRLARYSRFRRTIFEANTVETLANVLNAHKDNEKIQKAAREAMKLLL